MVNVTTGRTALSGKKLDGKARKEIIRRIRMRAELIRDRSRLKLFEQRRRYKYKVEQNEKKMDESKSARERNLNPVAVQIMPSRKYAKMIRNAANLSVVPTRPKYSNAVTTRLRVYGKRFDLVDKNPKLLIAEIGAKKKAMK